VKQANGDRGVPSSTWPSAYLRGHMADAFPRLTGEGESKTGCEREAGGPEGGVP
jgi:hypothetical protein